MTTSRASASFLRGRAARSARLAHNQEVGGSNPSPATIPSIGPLVVTLLLAVAAIVALAVGTLIAASARTAAQPIDANGNPIYFAHRSAAAVAARRCARAGAGDMRRSASAARACCRIHARAARTFTTGARP